MYTLVKCVFTSWLVITQMLHFLNLVENMLISISCLFLPPLLERERERERERELVTCRMATTTNIPPFLHRPLRDQDVRMAV